MMRVSMYLSLGTLRFNNATRTRMSKNQFGLISKATTLHGHHAFLYFVLSFLHDYDKY